MDFKTILFFLLCSLAAISCTQVSMGTAEDENIIGVKVDKLSSLVDFEGRESHSIVMFDDVSRRIFQFQVADMTFQRRIYVKQPQLVHSVVAQEKGNFIIDLFDQNVVVYNKDGHADENPIQLAGAPVSVAFRPELNLFVVYDSLNSVGIIKFDSFGNVIKSWVGGSFLEGAGSITSGDLMQDGRLVLAMGNSIAVVDLEQSLLDQKWAYTSFATTLGRISWIAPVRDNSQQVFVKAGTEIALIDLVNKTKLDSITLSDNYLEKVSKSFDAHLIVRSLRATDEIILYYPQNSKINSRSLQKQKAYIVNSQLHLLADRWSFIESENKTDWYDDSPNRVKQGRKLKMFRRSDMAALKTMAVESEAQALLSSSSLFQLFPADLGFAVKTDILTGVKKEAKHFLLRN